MIYYLVFGVSVVAVLLAVGIPAVTRLVRIPGRIYLRAVNEHELSEQALSYFKTLDEQAHALGFQHQVDFVFPGHTTPNENRLYYHPPDGTMLLVSLQSSGNRSVHLFEFVTMFADGTEVTTTNTPVSLIFEEPPWQGIKRMSASKGVDDLFASHKKRIDNRESEIHYPEEDRMLEQISRSQQRLFEHQVNAGLFRKDEESGMYVATSKVALRTVANILNPFTEEFTPARAAMGIGGALALFAAIVFLGREWVLAGPLSEGTGAEKGQMIYLVFSLAFVLAGLVAGFSFTRKGFLWGFLVSLPAILLALFFHPTLAHPIFYSLVTAQSGKTANVIGGSARQEAPRAAISTSLLVLCCLLVLGYLYIS